MTGFDDEFEWPRWARKGSRSCISFAFWLLALAVALVVLLFAAAWLMDVASPSRDTTVPLVGWTFVAVAVFGLVILWRSRRG